MMKTNGTESLRMWKRRVMRMVGALLLAGSAVGLSAAAASAQMACNYPYGSNTCLTLEDHGWGIYKIRVGIDIYMSQEQAQHLIDATGGAPFGVELLAHDHDDPADDTSGLGELLEVYQVWAGPNGLSGNFEQTVAGYLFNEDKDGRDELVARVTLYDPGYPEPAQFHSGIIVGYW